MLKHGVRVSKKESVDLISMKFEYSVPQYSEKELCCDENEKPDGVQDGVSTKNLRKDYYTNGVNITWHKYDKTTGMPIPEAAENICYKMLMRSPGKAKKGECIFIKDKLLDTARNYLTMGLYEKMPDKNAKIVELSAYSTLITATALDYIHMDDVDTLISDAIAQINSSSSDIKTTLETESKNVGYTLSNAMTSIWDTKEEPVISKYGDKLDELTTTNDTLDGIWNRQKDMIDAINSMANAYISKVEELLKQPTQSNLARDESADSDAENAVNRDNKNYLAVIGGGKGGTGTNPMDDGLGVLDTGKKTTTTTTTTSKKTGNNKAEVGDKVTFTSGEYYRDSYGGGNSGNSYLGKKVYITKINKSSNYPYHISTGSKFGSGDLGWVKLNQLKGYASGIMRVPNDQLAWTQEQGEEAIVRNDGSILTPLSKDVSVLNADMTKNLWDFMSNPGSFLNDYSDGEKFGVKNEDNSSSVVNQFDNLTFNLPNVQNSDDFIKEMAKNKKFEKMVCAMTVDRLNGGSSLAKYKYRS